MCCVLAPSLALAASLGPPVLGRPRSQCSLCSADDEAMATEVTPPANAELTELGKCLMKQEVRACALTATTLSLYSLSHLSALQQTLLQRSRLLECSPCGNHLLGTCMAFKGLAEATKKKGGWDPVITHSYRASALLGKRPWIFSPQGAPWLCLHLGAQFSSSFFFSCTFCCGCLRSSCRSFCSDLRVAVEGSP